MVMYYKDFVDYIIPIIGLIVSIVACVYTCLTYRKSRDILTVVDEERKYRWNQEELKALFSTIPMTLLKVSLRHLILSEMNCGKDFVL